MNFREPSLRSNPRTLPSVQVNTTASAVAVAHPRTPPGTAFFHLSLPVARSRANTSPLAPSRAFGSNATLLVVTITVSPASVGPPHGLCPIGAFQSSLPVAASRQKPARSPSFSLYRTGAATEH